MDTFEFPAFFRNCIVSHEEALKRTIRSGRRVSSGFATSEPHGFYAALWDHIQSADIQDLSITQALFMAPHRVLVGDALLAEGLFASRSSKLARKANAASRKLQGLHALVAHYRELKRRRIKFISPFVGAANNMVIPDNAVTRLLAPELVGRNTTRMGITDMHNIHFPDALEAIGVDADGRPRVDTWILAMTPPDAQGLLSHGPANGGNGEVTSEVLRRTDIDCLLYLNRNYPFTFGTDEVPNSVHLNEFRWLAEAGKLLVVEDASPIPALPKGSLDHPSAVELRIAENVVNHIELNAGYTYGRAIQVGFGGTGVLAIKHLRESSWTGRSYTEMLEPYTLDLFEAGKIAGSHFIERDGRRTPLDGKMVCTFTLGEHDSDFYRRLDRHPAVILAPASRVVIPEGFYHGLGINNCLAIDFYGHVNSGGRFKNHHSGIGGGAQIWRGLARGGVGYLCLKSTYRDFHGRRKSSIMPFMPEGTPISHVGPDLVGGREGARFFLVTEHGMVQMSGLSQSAFIRALISVAHPDFREDLKRIAYREFRV